MLRGRLVGTSQKTELLQQFNNNNNENKNLNPFYHYY